MAYKRQTSFMPFDRKRQASVKDESKELRNLATALEGQRKQTVKEFVVASNQQLTEMQRGDKIATKKDQYEIEELARFSKNLTNALTVGSRVLGKKYIDSQEAKGAKAYAENPIDVKELNMEINALHVKNQEEIDEIEKEARKQKILTLEEKLKLHETRLKRGSWGNGYTRAYLQEVGNGFLPHLMEITSSGEEWYQEPEIGDDGLPIEGTGIAFKDYMAQDLKTKGLMEQEILRRYIENNDLDGINAAWQNEYVIEPARKIITKWAAQQLQNDIIENARVERNGFLNEVNLDINEFDFNTVLKPVKEGEEGYEEYLKKLNKIKSLHENIQNVIKRVPVTYSNGGTPDGKTANQAMADDLYRVLLDSLSHPSIDEATALFLVDLVLGNEAKGIKPMMFETAVGIKPLTYFETFDRVKFELAVLNEKVDHERKIHQKNVEGLENDIMEGIVKYRTGEINRVELQEIYGNVIASPHFFVDSPEANRINTLYEGALQQSNINLLNDKESRDKLIELQKLYSNGIPISVLIDEKVNGKLIKQGIEEGVVLPYGTVHWIDENRDVHRQRQENISKTYLNRLTNGGTSNKNFQNFSLEYQAAATALSTDEYLGRIDFYLNNSDWLNQQGTTDKMELYGLASEQSYNDIIAAIPGMFDPKEENRKKGEWYEKGYTASATQADKVAVFDKPSFWDLSKQADTKTPDESKKRFEHLKKYLASTEKPATVLDGGILSNMLGVDGLGVTVENLPILLGGEKDSYENIPQIFVQAAEEDANGISALQIWNAERTAHGLSEIKVEQLPLSLQPAARIIGFLPREDLIEVQNGHVEIVIDKSGLISTEYLYNAWRSYDNLEVPASEVQRLSKALGIDYNLIYSPKGELLDSGIPLLEKIERHYFNEMLAKATNKVDDKNEALQNFWSLANGNHRSDWKTSYKAEEGGLDFINKYHANGGLVSGYDIAYDLLSDTELSVEILDEEFEGKKIKTSLLKGIADENLVQARANAETEKLDAQKYKEYVIDGNDWKSYYEYKTANMKAVTIESIDAEIEAHKATKGDISFDTRSTQNYYVDPRAYDYLAKLDSLITQKNLINLIKGGVGDTDWGLRAAMEDGQLTKTWLSRIFLFGTVSGIPNWTKDFRVISDIETVIGQTELTEMKKLAAKNAGLQTVPDSLEASLVVPHLKKEMEEKYITEFYKLLLMHPKFYTGDTYGVE